MIYTYRLGLGDMQLDAFSDGAKEYLTMWFLFLLMTVIVNIVMLNLLIAIISESFSKINSN
jgi:hypothetical protein